MPNLLSHLRRSLSEPHLVPRELNRQYYRLNNNRFNDSGTPVFDLDWDNLVILDACRYDFFVEAETELPGETSSRTSCASTTTEFLRANFADRSLNDSVCVTGNAWYQKLRQELDLDFYAFFDENHESSGPLVNRVREIVPDYPHKRFIVHLLPPHTPYVGPTADRHFPGYDEQHRILTDFRSNDISDDVLHQAYRENIDRVLSHVRELLSILDGKTIVTADHGELLGDRLRPIPIKDYGHYSQLYVKELTEVPLLIHDDNTRREIRAEPPENDRHQMDEGAVEERLRKLGYMDV
ncbi:alkaline phosphatase family protein [Halapricum salinum]|uniref:hypothetical protein n=1 Tax=Halapricum salinum TaxID=1457250 RepID=UPI0010A49F7F|nr:hypothetical protein [Halapricum salinum]